GITPMRFSERGLSWQTYVDHNGAVARFLDYLRETRGRRLIPTVKLLCNKVAWVIVRKFVRPWGENWSQRGLYWLHFPFSLRGEVLWSRPLGAWFWAADVLYLENMLHLHRHEPVDWFAPKPGDTVVDVGAFVGWYSIWAARAVGSN